MLTFAVALAGITVLAPAPVKPPAIPCTSNGGRDLARSSTERSGSPVNTVEPTSLLRNSCSENGSRFQLVSSAGAGSSRSEEHTSELQSRVDISYAVFCLKKK